MTMTIGLLQRLSLNLEAVKEIADDDVLEIAPKSKSAGDFFAQNILF